jgi:predicted PhzF superfamily epimerase YddE/YHI9
MRLPIYQVDAFTDRLFSGNPAAICPLEAWLPDAAMQAIAAENNLSETAFFVRDGADYAVRWFTPTVEVDLCGHATLAAGHVIFHFLEPQRESVRFHTLKAGTLVVTRRADILVMDFPSRHAGPAPAPPGLLLALGGASREVLRARDYLIVYDRAAEIAALDPDLAALAKVDCFAAIVTAPGEDGIDFVSRFFAPAQGVPEDPGDRLGALHIGAVLGEAPRQDGPRSPPALAARRRTALRAQRRSGEYRRTCRRLSPRPRFDINWRILESGWRTCLLHPARRQGS